MNTALATFNALFTTDHADANRRSRLKLFSEWLDTNGKSWLDANLAEYRDYLLHTRKSPLAPISARNHLATIRQRYRDLMEDNSIISAIEAQAYVACQEQGFEPNPANVQATVNRWLRFITNNTSPHKAQVDVLKIASHEDDRFIRLTPDQVNRYLESILDDSLMSIRDAAAVALVYMGGLREQEAADLTIEDMSKTYQRKPALRIEKGKGKKKRMVILEPMLSYAWYVTDWIEQSGITEGKVLRGFTPGGELRGSLSTDAIQDIMRKYSVDGLKPRPHDFRRSYAKNLYDSGWKIEAIALQMGHENIATTIKYIGEIR